MAGVLLCGLWYGAFLAAWPLIGSTYRQWLVDAGAALLGSQVEVITREEWGSAPVPPIADIAVLLLLSPSPTHSPDAPVALAKAVSTLHQPYASVAFTVALFLATPLSWHQRAGRIVGAILLLHGLMLLCVVIDLEHLKLVLGIARSNAPTLLQPTILLLHASVTDWPAGVFIIPIVLWFVICGRTLRGGRSELSSRSPGWKQARAIA